jgi:hypothetical protein
MALTGDAQSQLYRETIAVNFAAAETVVSDTLLAPPTVVAPTAPTAPAPPAIVSPTPPRVP